MSFLMGTLSLAVVTALACALPGVFVVLRKNSMLADAIGHAVFPGIIVGYFFTQDLDSPLLIVGAALAGLIVVLGAEYLGRTGLITGDAPQGLVFPALFSVGVILVTRNFADVHLDTHVVLVGDLNLAAFEELTIGGTPIGPRYLFVMLAVAAANALFLRATFPALTVTTFDPRFAATIGIHTRALTTAFMFMVSVTVTAAFNAAGAILVIALMIIPAAAAYLLTRTLKAMISVVILIAVAGAIGGFWIAYALDTATSAAMSVCYGLVFAAAYATNRIRRYLANRGNAERPA